MPEPVMRPIADNGVLVEFGTIIDDAIHVRVLALDGALAAQPFDGFTEAVPSYAALFVGYDPLVTDFETVAATLKPLLGAGAAAAGEKAHWEIPVCYADRFAPDMEEFCERTGLSRDAVIAAHSGATYKLYMYGFAPGYAYLGGVPEALRLPRKRVPVTGVAKGALMVAAEQCIVTTMVMPSGWWVLGRAARTPLPVDPGKPFLFDVGDTVSFVPVAEDAFEEEGA